MFDLHLRPLKDRLFIPLARLIPSWLNPNHLTVLAFVSGLLSCYHATSSTTTYHQPLLYWTLNRILDCLDGTLARIRNTSSQVGGFLDLLFDFIIYSLIPIAVGVSQGEQTDWLAIATLEASVHVNNFVLFYAAAVEAKFDKKGEDGGGKGLTSVVQRPAVVEGFEAGLFFTVMLVWPEWIGGLSWLMAALVVVGVVQRSWWVVGALGRIDREEKERSGKKRKNG